MDKQGNVFFTDQPNDKIIQWSAKTGALTTFSANSGGRANGMYFDAAGNLITCADMEGAIWRIDKKGNHTVIAKNYDGKILNGVLFKADSTKGLVFYLHGNGGSIKGWGDISTKYTS